MKTKDSKPYKRIALITGATSDIGKAIASNLIKSGYFVVAVSKTDKKLRKLERQFEDNIFCRRVDFTSCREVMELIKYLEENFERVEVVVNAAAIYHSENKAYYNIDFEDYSIEEVLNPLKVGFTAHLILMHGLVSLLKQGSSIINITGTFSSAKGWLPYYLSKKALEDLTIGLSEEFQEKGIRVNAISPADTYTNAYKRFFPQYARKDQCLDPKDIADKTMDLLENRSINGQIIELRR